MNKLLPLKIQLFGDPGPQDNPPANPSLINNKLLELETENKRLKAQIEQLTKDKELMQLDYSNKISTVTVEFETKELQLNRTIRDLHQKLETRNTVNDQINRGKKKKSINQLYEEAFGD